MILGCLRSLVCEYILTSKQLPIQVT
ncbi:hypothetical protein Rin_00003250, partial [Candidatus Regiella insecticola 5.15]